jgi:predicted amino acid-binding ACT domain protein
MPHEDATLSERVAPPIEKPRSPTMSTYWTFRATLDDRPGGLAATARAIADLGANILDVDVHLLDHDQVTDDVTVELAYWAEPVAVEHALRAAGAREVTARRLDPHDLVDGPTRVLDLATRLARAGASADEVRQTLLDLLGADHCWLEDPSSGVGGSPLAERAVQRCAPVVGLGYLARLPGMGADTRVWLVAIPWVTVHCNVVVVARRRARFTATEVARAQALLGLAAALGADSGLGLDPGHQDGDVVVSHPVLDGEGG